MLTCVIKAHIKSRKCNSVDNYQTPYLKESEFEL